MKKPFVSIIIPYYGRHEQLNRSLYCLAHQTTHTSYEVILINDGGEPLGTFLTDMDVRQYHIRDAGSPPRSPNKAWRFGFDVAQGDFIILTHPEIMTPPDAIDRLIASAFGRFRPVPMMYCLDQSFDVDSAAWWNDIKNLEKFPGFMGVRNDWGYTNVDAPSHRNHLSFSGQYIDWWQEIGFLPDVEDPNFASDDAWLHRQELERGIPSIPCDLTVYHQWHEKIYGNIMQESSRAKTARESVKVKAQL